MTEPLKTYDGAEVSVIVGGRPITGLTKEGAVSIDRQEDAWMTRRGLKGNVTRSKNNNKGTDITIKVEQTSKDNDYFSEKAIADEKTASGVVSLLIRDAKGSTLVDAPECWIRKMAKADFGMESGEREWVFECASADMFVGGN